MAEQLLSDNDISTALRGLDPGWARDGDSMTRSIEARTFADGIRLVDAVAVVADQRNHHPDIDIRWTTITFTLSTHSAGGLTSNDIALATEIDGIASDAPG